MDKVYSLLFVVAIVMVVGVSGCTSQNQTSSTNSVNIQNMAFSPSTLTVPVGTTVTWKNLDNVAHHVVSDTGAFDSGVLNNGQSFNFTFTKAGNYPYHCSIHPSMTGTIIVTSTGSGTGSGTSNQSTQNSSTNSNKSSSNTSNNTVKKLIG